MARPKRTEEQITEAPVVQEEQNDSVVDGVSIETSLFSFGYEGIEYMAKDGMITIPIEAVEVFKSHG